MIIDALVAFSIRRRWLTILCALAVGAFGVFNFMRLPIDAVPDITNVQAQVNVAAPGLTALEVEQRITFPVETAMSGLPGLELTRSLSRYGLSQTTIVFREGTDIYFARQLVGERIQQVRDRLPPGADVALGPVATGLGEIYVYSVSARKEARKADGSAYSPTDLREIQDWIVKPRLRQTPGVVEVNSIGGFEKQYHVLADPRRLFAHGLGFRELGAALEAGAVTAGAGYVERNGEQYVVRAPGQAQGVGDLERIVVAARGGVPVRVADLARVETGGDLRTGAATVDGEEQVVGTAILLLGENSRAVATRVRESLSEIARSLPEGVELRALYDRTRLVDATIATVEKNLLEGALLVVGVLFLVLGNFRAALIAACVAPLSMLIAVTGMFEMKISANLMSLGAIDFGIIIDGAVIIVENCLRRLAARWEEEGARPPDFDERLAIVVGATREVIGPSLFGALIIGVVYLPILTLAGVEGKMFSPMALTVLLALTGATVLSLTFVPAAVALVLSGPTRERESAFMRLAHRVYDPALSAALAHRGGVALVAASLAAACALVAFGMGREFTPTLDEGDLAIQAMRPPGASLTQSVQMQARIEKRLLRVPEVETVFSRIGTAEVATDPMPPSVADGVIILKPRAKWPDPGKDKALVDGEIAAAAQELPGSAYEISQPIQLRFNELISGVRSDVGVKIFGDDLGELVRLAARVQTVLQTVPGARDVRTEPVSGLPGLNVVFDRDAMARRGVQLAEAQNVVQTAVGGRKAGMIFEGDRRFDVVLRLPEALRESEAALLGLPTPLAGEGGRFAPLSEIASVERTEGPNQINREQGKRRIVVSANVRGRDLGSFVADAQARIEKSVRLPAAYWIAWGGQFEQLASAARRLAVVTPVALGLILLLLFLSLGSFANAALTFASVPLALTGGIVALWARGMPLSISAGVGFIALSGVATLNGLVIVSFIERLRAQGLSVNEAARRGALARLRPVLMTALVASLGFVPMALATGAGAEAQRPLATVVIGGIVSSTLLTLIVGPALYSLVWRGGRAASQAAEK